MRVKIPEFGSKKELFEYLKNNKDAIIESKKSALIKSDPFCFTPVVKKGGENKKDDSGIIVNPSSLRVKVVANAHYWADSYLDVIIKDAPLKSIEDKTNIIYFLKNHGRDVDDIIADIVSVTLEDISLKDLGIDQEGKTQCVAFLADVQKDYDPKVFNLYLRRAIKQHSIGLYYSKISLAVNFDGEGYEEEFSVWNEYYSQVINKEEIDKYGYFWVIEEYVLKENSAVLWGANSLTPTLETEDIKQIKFEVEKKEGSLTKDDLEEMESDFLSRIKNYNF